MKPRTATQRRLIIDDLARVLRKPSAAPTITPAEVIALSLNGTMWIPGRLIEADDMVVYQTLRLLRQAGYAIVPATRDEKDMNHRTTEVASASSGHPALDSVYAPQKKAES